MLNLKRSVLGLVIGGFTIVGIAAPSAMAQKDKPAPGASGQPDKKEHKKDEKAHAKVGEAAPDFTLTDTDGKTVKLADYKGKIVVLDWFNPTCPVCAMHYKASTIQNTAAKFKDKNVVFLAINSGGKGIEGSDKAQNATAKKDWKVAFPILLDESGKVGHSYGAKTTPHCFVIDAKGTLVYAGAIDNGSAGKVGTTNYVEKALEQVIKGETVTTAETKSYGCGVHYGSGT